MILIFFFFFGYKCPSCHLKAKIITMVPSQGRSSQKMASDQSGVFAPLMQFKCKGVVPKKFRFSGRWQCNIEFLLEEQHFEFMNGVKRGHLSPLMDEPPLLLNWMLKRIKYEIRLGEPNRSMSMGQKKVKPILCVESLTK